MYRFRRYMASRVHGSGLWQAQPKCVMRTKLPCSEKVEIVVRARRGATQPRRSHRPAWNPMFFCPTHVSAKKVPHSKCVCKSVPPSEIGCDPHTASACLSVNDRIPVWSDDINIGEPVSPPPGQAIRMRTAGTHSQLGRTTPPFYAALGFSVEPDNAGILPSSRCSQ